MTIDPQALSDFAQALAREAGDLIAAERRQGLRHDYKAQSELVTHADLKADALISNAIRSSYPDHRILSEESEPDLNEADDLDTPLWIIDPIDGTVNYAYGHSQVAISIAFACQGRVQLGVVYCPFLGEMFVARQGHGAHLNGNAIRHSGATELRHSLLATGFPYGKETVQELVARLGRVLQVSRDIRRIGSAALDICWVACGRLDGYYETVSPWDFAAARLIALEAGARCGHFSPVPGGRHPELWGRDLIITAPAIYEDLERIL